MSDESHDELHDIYGKIDALLGRRLAVAPSRDIAELDDFPLLTEVVSRDDALEPILPSGWDEEATESPPARGVDAVANEDADSEPATNFPNLGILPPAYDLDLLAQLPPDPLEDRLAEMVARQQAQLEAMIRRVVREELERFHGGR